MVCYVVRCLEQWTHGGVLSGKMSRTVEAWWCAKWLERWTSDVKVSGLTL